MGGRITNAVQSLFAFKISTQSPQRYTKKQIYRNYILNPIIQSPWQDIRQN